MEEALAARCGVLAARAVLSAKREEGSRLALPGCPSARFPVKFVRIQIGERCLPEAMV
jgi:hypothetical protein